VRLSEAGTTFAASIKPFQNGRVRFTGTKGQRAVVEVESRRGQARDFVLRIDRGDEERDGLTFYGSGKAGVGPVLVDGTEGYSAFLAPGASGAEISVTVRAAPADLTARTTVGGAPARVNVKTPYQAAVVTFAGRSGQQVMGRWKSSDISESVDLVLYAPDGRLLAEWTDTTEDSDEVSLPATGEYRIEVLFDEPDLVGEGTVSVVST
jgi:hypothetical protein